MHEGLARYRITYDRWFHETELHASGYIAETMGILTEKGLTYEKDGAVWFKTTAFGCPKDDVLVKSNGFYTYFAVDIAYQRDKFLRRGFDRVINLWGADHHGSVARLKAAMEAIGVDPSRFEVLLFQFVNLMRDGEIVRMSKRTGKAITLENLLDEIGVDAARFFFNARQPDSKLDFDLDLAIRSDAENPVYYVQYAHARICSLLGNLAASDAAAPVEDADLSCLNSAEETALIRALAQLPDEVRAAAESRDPSRVNRYLVGVAAAFHRCYNAHRIIGSPHVRERGLLAACTRDVIAIGLGIIRVNAPAHM